MILKCQIRTSLVACIPAILLGCSTAANHSSSSEVHGVSLSQTGRLPAGDSNLERQNFVDIARHVKVLRRKITAPSNPEQVRSVEISSHEIRPVNYEPNSDVKDPRLTESEFDSALPPSPETTSDLAGGMTLEKLEALALEHNPAIQQAYASAQKASGYQTQVLIKPNPFVEYQAQQLADRSTDQHLLIIGQEFVTGGKLQLNHRVMNATLSALLQEYEAQRLRVTTDIRTRFYHALSLQRQLELIDEFSLVADKGVRIAELRKKAGEGSQVDVLQAIIQSNEINLSQQQTQAKLAGIWREISALAGVHNLPQSTLTGTLPIETPAYDWEQLASTIVSTSPEYAAAQGRISRACANLDRQLTQPIPNVAVQFGAGVDNATDSGMINVQFGVPLPLNNCNQGNISAAQAEVSRSQMDAKRIANDIEARLAVVSREYETAAAAVLQYGSNILPSALASMELAETAYEAGEIGFVQLLITRKTYFDANLQYVSAQSDLAAAQAKIDGYVLTGALHNVPDDSGDDSLRSQTFSQQ